MSPDRSHLCIPLGRSLVWTATLAAVGPDVPTPPIGPHAPIDSSKPRAMRARGMRPTLRDVPPTPFRIWQHAGGLDMLLDLQAASSEYIGWLPLEANRSPNTVRAYESELRKLISFLAANGHSLAVSELHHEDLRAYQRHLAGRLKGPASRARALVAGPSFPRSLARGSPTERAPPHGDPLPKAPKRAAQPS